MWKQIVRLILPVLVSFKPQAQAQSFDPNSANAQHFDLSKVGTNKTTNTTYSNPIFTRNIGDPWMTRYSTSDSADWYLFTYSTNDNITLQRARSLTDNWDYAEQRTVFQPNQTSGEPWSTDIWAPEIHNISGTWYIIFTATPDRDQPPPLVDAQCPYECPAINHRMFVLEGDGPDPWTANFTMKGMLDTYNQFAIDGYDNNVPSSSVVFHSLTSLLFLPSLQFMPRSQHLVLFISFPPKLTQLTPLQHLLPPQQKPLPHLLMLGDRHIRLAGSPLHNQHVKPIHHLLPSNLTLHNLLPNLIMGTSPRRPPDPPRYKRRTTTTHQPDHQPTIPHLLRRSRQHPILLPRHARTPQRQLHRPLRPRLRRPHESLPLAKMGVRLRLPAESSRIRLRHRPRKFHHEPRWQRELHRVPRTDNRKSERESLPDCENAKIHLR